MNVLTILSRRKRQQAYQLFLSRWQLLWLGILSIAAYADLPTPVDPSNGAPNGNYLQFMEGWRLHRLSYFRRWLSMGRLDTAVQI